MGFEMATQTRDKSAVAGPGGQPYSDRTYHAMAETFRALADPTRAKIVHWLSFGESSVNHLAERLGITASAVSHQLRMLRQLGLVRFRREGQSAIYALDDPHIAILFQEAYEHVEDFLQEGKKRREWL
jgi:DNA-binding transcriptional ArsR family regulator